MNKVFSKIALPIIVISALILSSISLFLSFPKFTVEAQSSWLTGWSYRKKITIDNTKIDDTITNFPVRVYLNADGDIGASARADGYDIRFTSSDGTTLLKYEREDFAIATNQATGNFWVKIPSVSSSTDTEFYMYYGNSGASDGQDATNVWTNNQKGVWLMGEGSGSTAYDSTTNSNDGTLVGDTSWTTGRINGALSFDGDGDYVDYGTSINTGSALTYTAWIKFDVYGSFTIVNNAYNWFRVNVQKLNYYPDLSGGGVTSLYHTLITGNWYHVAITQDGTDYVFYINAVDEGSGTANAISNTATYHQIGRYGTGSNYFNGTIDNVMIYDRALSAAEIKADYNSGNNSLLSLGGEEAPAQAAGMESTNYKIAYSSINVGGTEGQVSSPGGYKLAETIGEIGTGVSTSSGYKLNAGYQQMQEVYIAITVPTEGLTMNQPGNMSIIVNQVTNAVAGAVWNVKTDAPAGYTLSFSAEQTNCLRKDGSAYFTDYSEVSEGTPEAWSADNSSYQFGFSVFGNDAPDGTWGAGSSCTSPASNNLKYRGFDSTNNIQVASSSSRTGASGTDTAFCAAAEQKNVFAPNGSYTANITATAVTQ